MGENFYRECKEIHRCSRAASNRRYEQIQFPVIGAKSIRTKEQRPNEEEGKLRDLLQFPYERKEKKISPLYNVTYDELTSENAAMNPKLL